MGKKLTKIDANRCAKGIETIIMKHPDALYGDCFPLEHKFAGGMYMRQITAPKGALMVGKTHRQSHPSFLLKGKVRVLTSEGIRTLTAPASFVTKAGDKRAGLVIEEMVWVDVFKTKSRSIKTVERECVKADAKAKITTKEIKLLTKISENLQKEL